MLLSTSMWRCPQCGNVNYYRVDKAPCICGQPEPVLQDEIQAAADRLDEHLKVCPKCSTSIFMCVSGYGMLNEFHMALYFAILADRMEKN